MRILRRAAAIAVLAALASPIVPATPSGPASADVPEWQAVFDPLTVHTFNLQLSSQDWDTVRKDTTNEIEKPAQFWQDDEAPILVSVRRKSSRALPSEGNPIKVGLKIDINEYVKQEWHGLLKLSLENGADSGVVQEGVAWNLHRMAADSYGYVPGYASWVRLFVNGQYIGVYANVEQRDKQMLKNRGVWEDDTTWLYDQGEISAVELEEGDPHSPAYDHLCFSPFRIGQKRNACPGAPTGDAAFETDVEQWVNMQAMLTEGAVDALTSNSDALLSHGKNVAFADFADAREITRMYFPWDLDTVFNQTDDNIYARGSGRKISQSPYQQVILNHPTYRVRYNSILLGLLDGPVSVAQQQAFLDALQPVLGPVLATDPYPTSGTGTFSALRSWVAARATSVRAQVAANTNPPPRS